VAPTGYSVTNIVVEAHDSVAPATPTITNVVVEAHDSVAPTGYSVTNIVVEAHDSVAPATPTITNVVVEAHDSVAPTGYSVSTFTLDGDNATFTMAGAETGTALAYTITSSAGGTPVTGNVSNVASTTESISGIDVSGLSDGTLTVSVILTDDATNTGSAATKTVEKAAAATPDYYISGLGCGGNLNYDYTRDLKVEIRGLNPAFDFHMTIEKDIQDWNADQPFGSADLAPHIFTYSNNEFVESDGKLMRNFVHGFGGLWNAGLHSHPTSNGHNVTITVWQTDGDTVLPSVEAYLMDGLNNTNNPLKTDGNSIGHSTSFTNGDATYPLHNA